MNANVMVVRAPRVANWKAWAAHRQSVAEPQAMLMWSNVFDFIGSRMLRKWGNSEGFFVG